MVIDSSAVVAIFLGEPDRRRLLDLIRAADVRIISAATVLETAIVLESSLGEAAGREFDEFLKQAGIETIPVDLEQLDMARLGWRKYGKGRHPARLNFGDCFPYALAKLSGEPLLAKGRDFPQCDVELVR